MSILVYLEHHGSDLPKGSLSALRAALEIKAKHGYGKAVGLLIGGAEVADAANAAAAYGLDEICYIQSDTLKTYLALNYEAAFKAVIAELNPTAIVALSTSRGKDLLPRIAQALEAGQASDILNVLDGGVFKRPMYAGNVIAEVEITTAKKVVTVRGSAFNPADQSSAKSPVRALTVNVSPATGQEFVAFDTVKSERPELTEASIVVSGGRALKSAENFEKYIAPLADALGAAIGASRAAVDSGYAPNDWQVGQTGKIVAPSLYVAVGISGAIQHLAGMKDSKVIVAINTDAEAPIFEVADYGLVADLYEAVPQLTEEIKKAKS